MIDKADYTAITGAEPPEDFATCLQLAQEHIHLTTGYAYTCDVRSLPRMVVDRLKAAVAYQVQFVHLMGGLEGVQGPDAQSASLGSFSYSGESGAVSQRMRTAPAAAVYLPFLVAYARGMSQ